MRVKIKNFNIDVIANSGQIFRVYKNDALSNDEYFVYDLFEREKHLRIITSDFINYDLSCSKKEYNEFYENYFDLNYNYQDINKVVLKSDKYLKKCIEYGNGLKILNQDPFEMLISFIISQRKSIKAIRTSIERLCKYCGKRITNKYLTYYTFPSVSAIIKNKSKLAKCGLGYRVPYIVSACEDIVSGRIELYNKNVSTDYLMNIRGVGIKVASCIMLFAYHDLRSLPIDVWMKRVIDNEYNGQLPKSYEKYAGIIQQYLFNYAKDVK